MFELILFFYGKVCLARISITQQILDLFCLLRIHIAFFEMCENDKTVAAIFLQKTIIMKFLNLKYS
jgi:hypothetical protein